jgi:phenol hydroxylase P1 protein
MQIDIKSLNIQPLRHTYDHVARHLGKDMPASRYLEATIGVQAEKNFHYRPTWDPDREIFDTRRSALVMKNWYAFLDPRQYYYGTWTMARSRQQEAAERQFEYVAKRGLLDLLTPAMRDKVGTVILPLRHIEYAANLNHCYMTAYGYGAAITQATMMCAEDRLGIAQHITRIGLVLDGQTGDSLRSAKGAWQDSAVWQPMRSLVETMLTTKDWFELLVAQDFILDGLLYPLVYQHFDQELVANGATGVPMLTEFMAQWYEEHTRWVDQMLKIAAGESAANVAVLEGWIAQWKAPVLAALEPIAQHALGARAEHALEAVAGVLAARAAKSGLAL